MKSVKITTILFLFIILFFSPLLFFSYSKFGKNNSQVKGLFSVSETKEENAKLLFLGDVMLDRYNRVLMERHGAEWMTEKIQPLFLGQDLVIANLEGPVTDSGSVSVGTEVGEKGHMIFTFDKQQTKNFLSFNRIGAVNVGNNHILNFGEEGARQTKDFLKENRIDFFGDYRGKGEEEQWLEKNINGIKIAFLNYNQFGGQLKKEELLALISKAKQGGNFVVVYTHWGVEYALKESTSQREMAHSFIDAGADLIIGSHPHVVQPAEEYKGKMIFYSLGNFIFDQYFSRETRIGLGVGVSISQDQKTEFVLTPFYLQNNGQLVLLEGKEKEELLTKLRKN